MSGEELQVQIGGLIRRAAGDFEVEWVRNGSVVDVIWPMNSNTRRCHSKGRRLVG